MSASAVTTREYETFTGETAYSISYGNPQGYTILVTPQRYRGWCVWHSDSITKLARSMTLTQAINHAEQIGRTIAANCEQEQP